MRKLTCILFALIFSFSCKKIVVFNDSDFVRYAETIELPLNHLPTRNLNFVVTDDDGNEIPSQITYDDKLIFQVNVPAKSSSVYKIRIGLQQKYDTLAVGAIYHDRLDDLAWESDLAAYRIYGPQLQKSGEKAFGNDIWVKNNTNLPVVADRYRKELKEGISYHQDNGNGYDGYNVGPTLGAGRTAVIHNDEIVYPYCYEKCVILDNGPIRFTAELTYKDTLSFTEKRRISIDAGSFLNHEIVWYTGLSNDCNLITGIVLHDDDCKNNFISQDSIFISHIENIGTDQIYIAALFPEPVKDVGIKYGHLTASNVVKCDSLDYWWGASWNRSTEYPMRDFDAWNTYLGQFYLKVHTPLTLDIL